MPAQFGLSEVQQEWLWVLRSTGMSMRAISRELGCQPTVTRRCVMAVGGRRPVPRRRAACCLTVGEREEISRGLARGDSLRAIAVGIGRAHSTVSREVARNGGRDRYRAGRADLAGWKRARRPKPSKLAGNEMLRSVVEDKLQQCWSPQQISGWLAREYAGLEAMQISHETIYLSLFIQSRGALRTELARYLRTGRVARRPAVKKLAAGQSRNPGMIMISERPAEADDRAVPGHWEGDLLFGTKSSAIATLVERSTRYVQLVALPDGKRAEAVRVALTQSIGTLPAQLWRSLTWDQGHEMAQHAQFTIDSQIQVYFCDPHSPWQRGSNENTNGLLRQYFPKGQKITTDQAELDRVAAQLNGRPRETLDWRNPADCLAELTNARAL